MIYQEKILNKWILLAVGILLYAVLCTICIIGGGIESSRIIQLLAKASSQYLSDYKSLPNLLIQFCIFYFFLHTDIGTKKTINRLASGTLAAYLIHQTPNFIPYIWEDTFKSSLWINSNFLPVGQCLIAVIILLVGIVVDGLRKRFIEPLWVRSRLFIVNDINKFTLNC